MRRLIDAGTIALVATVGLTGSAMAGAKSRDFQFEYDSAYGQNGLSEAYAGPTTTGQSYGTGVAINPSDPSQKIYTLVEANPNIGVGGPRGAFPAASRTIPPSSTSATYLGPYYILRRTRDGAIDTTFGANGYISDFTTSTETSYKFSSLCLDPGTGNIVIVGQETTSSGPVGVVERLIPPDSGSDTAALDTSFNPSGPRRESSPSPRPTATIPLRCMAVRWSTKVRAQRRDPGGRRRRRSVVQPTAGG
jgi:hypothetical protein